MGDVRIDPGASRNDSNESRVAEIVADFLDRVNAGQAVDVDRLLQENADLEPDLGRALKSVLALCPQAAASGPPRRIGGYEIRRELGRGGMGISSSPTAPSAPAGSRGSSPPGAGAAGTAPSPRSSLRWRCSRSPYWR